MSFDNLPTELLHVIALDSEAAYKALILAYPRFAREVTPGKRVDYMVYFGHDVKIVRGEFTWTRHGIYHRLDGPANHIDNDERWYRNGVLHRDDGPAVFSEEVLCNGRVPVKFTEMGSVSYGYIKWYRDGLLHRDGGPAVIQTNGCEYWYQHGKLHRDDGPASTFNRGRTNWYRSWLHCTDTPYKDKISYTWYQHGVRIEKPAFCSPG